MYYKFNVGWQGDTEAQRRVGDFLCGLGRKKSRLIILAVSEYLDRHPDMPEAGIKDSEPLTLLTMSDVRREVMRILGNEERSDPQERKEEAKPTADPDALDDILDALNSFFS